jgi:hypothetical protein
MRWLNAQRSAESALRPQGLKLCPYEFPGRLAKLQEEAANFPPAAIPPPGGTIKVTAPQEFLDKRLTLSHLVIGLMSEPLTGAQLEKVAVQLHSGQLPSNSAPIALSGVKFGTAYWAKFGRGWFVFYCDPRTCQRDEDSAAAVRAVAADPDVIALARGDGTGGPQTGPYIVEISREP